jgi:amino acid permease
LIIAALGCEAFLYVIIYLPNDTGYFATAALGAQVAYILISVTAIVFPFRMKRVFEASPAAKYKIGGFPVLSLVGILALIVNLWIGYVLLASPLAVVPVSTDTSVAFVIGIFVACLVVYCIAWGVRKSQGIDLGLSFKELPPE